MKKILIVAFVGMLSFPAFSQKGSDNGFKLCVHAGVLSANGTYDPDGTGSGSASSKIGFKAGVGTSFNLASNINFTPEINYVSKGMKIARVGTGYAAAVDVTTNFLEIPLNVSYNFGDDSKGLYAGLGPVISMGIGGSYSGTVTSIAGSQSQSGSVKFDGKKQADLPANDQDFHANALEFGGNVFVGYKINQDFNVKVMYNLGFSNLSPEDKGSVKTNYFGLTVGYSLLK